MRALLYPRMSDDMMELAHQILPSGIHLETLRQGSDEDVLVSALRSVDAFVGFLRPPMPSSRIYDAMAHLKLVQVLSAGYDRLDVEVMRKIRVPVATNGGANAVAVAEHTIMLMLATYRQFAAMCATTRAGSWRVDSVGQQQLFELEGKTVGLIGFGMIGREVAKRARAFGTAVLYHDMMRADGATEEALGVRYASLEELLSSSDVVSLHVPLSPATRHMIGKRELEIMKPSAVLINTCRGDVVDNDALYDALKAGTIAAAGLDTVEPEPPPPGFPLFSLPNVTATPHVAGHSRESWPKRMRNAFANLERVASGQPPLWIIPEMRDLF